MKQGSFLKPMIVTYSYSWMYFCKMYATIIVRFNVEYINLPITASEEEIAKKILKLTGHKSIRIIDYCDI